MLASEDKGHSNISGSGQQGKKDPQWIIVDELSDGFKEKDKGTIFIKTIPESVLSKYELQEEFEGFGEIVHVHIDSERKFAFVWFTEEEHANSVIGQVLSIGGENVEVFPGTRSDRVKFQKEARRLERQRQSKIVSDFKATSDRDACADLLKLFGTALNTESADLLGCLPSEQTGRIMEHVVLAVEHDKPQSIDGICDIINSLGTKFPDPDTNEFEEKLRAELARIAPPPTKKQKKEEQSHERMIKKGIVTAYKSQPLDALGSLLAFFASELTPDAVEFTESLPTEQTSKLMELVADCIMKGNFLIGDDLIRNTLNSLEPAKVEHVLLQRETKGPRNTKWQSWSDDPSPLMPGAKQTFHNNIHLEGAVAGSEKVRAIVQDLQRRGGSADLGAIGGKFKMSKVELENAGFLVSFTGHKKDQKMISVTDRLVASLAADDLQTVKMKDRLVEAREEMAKRKAQLSGTAPVADTAVRTDRSRSPRPQGSHMLFANQEAWWSEHGNHESNQPQPSAKQDNLNSIPAAKSAIPQRVIKAESGTKTFTLRPRPPPATFTLQPRPPPATVTLKPRPRPPPASVPRPPPATVRPTKAPHLLAGGR